MGLKIKYDGNGDKANDTAISALQQLVTLASGTLVLSITFIKDFVTETDNVLFALVPAGWVLLTLSIWSGWVSLADMARQMSIKPKGEYIFSKNPQRKRARFAQYSFLIGLSSIAAFAVFNFKIPKEKTDPEKPVQNNFYCCDSASFRMDSIASVGGFKEGEANKGIDEKQLHVLQTAIADDPPISLLIIGEVDRRELKSGILQQNLGSNISLARARAEFVKSKLYGVCKQHHIRTVALSNGAYYTSGKNDEREFAKDRRVVVYGFYGN